MKVSITFDIDTDSLQGYTDEYLGQLWYIAQANPAPIEDRDAGNIAERIGREIIRRWLAQTSPALWHHQGEHHYWYEFTRLAEKYAALPESTDPPSSESATPKGT